jgi:hypothetical protein
VALLIFATSRFHDVVISLNEDNFISDKDTAILELQKCQGLLFYMMSPELDEFRAPATNNPTQFSPPRMKIVGIVPREYLLWSLAD